MGLGGVLGALITFSAVPWYSAYATTVGPWGLTPIEDQQLAGLNLWIPASVVYFAASIALLGAWLGRPDETSPGAEVRSAGEVPGPPALTHAHRPR
jgi:putative membrane protein